MVDQRNSYTKDRISEKVLKFLDIAAAESLDFHMKLASNPIYVNSVRKTRTNLIIVRDTLYLIDYFRFPIRRYTSWREADILLLSSISHIEAKMKKYILAPSPVLAIATSNNDLYEIVFFRKEKCIKIFHEISELVRRSNPQVVVENKIPEIANWWPLD
jgi:hypothetical protein